MTATRVEYLYRDAGNYKFYGEFFVSGLLTSEMLQPYLFNSEWFIPEVVGVPSLVPVVRNDDDHMLHELVEFTRANDSTILCSSSELIRRFKLGARREWFGALPITCLC